MQRILILLLSFIALQTRAQDYKENIPSILDTIQITGYAQQNSASVIPKTLHSIKIDSLRAPAIQSLEDVLALVSGVDVRTRGGKGVQADISLRGGNFDQVLILLNGIPVNNPQTGHLSLDIPVDFSMLDRIDVLEGAAGHNFGVNSYSGVINLITKKPNKKAAVSQLAVGQFGYLKADANLSQSFQKWGLFSGLTYQQSSGYLNKDSINNTDFRLLKYFINLQYKHDKFPVNLQAGYHQKDFGANSFYTSKYPWQYEKTQGYFANLSTKFGRKIKWKASATYKLNFDQFQLFRESEYHYQNGFFVSARDTAQYAPGAYYHGHNNHKTQVLRAVLQARFNSRLGITHLSLSTTQNRIYSNVLGIPLQNPIVASDRVTYTKSATRNYLEAAFNQSYHWHHFFLGAGVHSLYIKAYNWQVDAGAYVNYVKPHFTHYISVNSASRLPSFTDLYYAGPSNIGNPGLQPEIAYTYEMGSKFHQKNIKANMSLFYRQAFHTIDWIKYQPADKWQPQNLTRLHTYGIEFDATKKFNDFFVKQLHLSYAYLEMQKAQNTPFISKYALDYLKHNLVLNTSHRFLFHSTIDWTLSYKKRMGQYLDYVNNSYQLFDYQPYILVNAKWSKRYKNTIFAISVDNIFNIDYRDLSYVKMPGRWLIAELHYRF